MAARDARELAEEVGLLVGQRTAAEDADGIGAMRPDRVADAEGDAIVLSSSAFGGLNDDGDFLVQSGAPKAPTLDPWLLYNTTTGYLSYDADGSGAGATVPIAKFENTPFLHADDFTFLI